jgi:hypothetical protein
MLAIVAVGNSFDGLTLYGPFKSVEEANEWADTLRSSEEWTVVPVHQAVTTHPDA